MIILPSTTSDSYTNEEDHMRAIEFHKALGQLRDMAKFYGFEVKLQYAKNN